MIPPYQASRVDRALWRRFEELMGDDREGVIDRLTTGESLESALITITAQQVAVLGEDPEPQPGDGPDYHHEHDAWKERQRFRKSRDIFIDTHLNVLNRLEPHMGCIRCRGPLDGNSRCPKCQK